MGIDLNEFYCSGVYKIFFIKPSQPKVIPRKPSKNDK